MPEQNFKSMRDKWKRVQNALQNLNLAFSQVKQKHEVSLKNQQKALVIKVFSQMRIFIVQLSYVSSSE